MKTHTQIILVIAMLCMGRFAIAQKVIPVKLEIAKEIPGETFPNIAFKLEFWIQEENKFIALDATNTKILLFEDDLGTNILKAHQEAIYNKSIIDFENSRDITGAIGFKLLISSEVLPAENAKELHLKAMITYFIENESEPEESTIIKGFVPNNEIAEWQGKSISIVKNGSSSSDENNEKRIGYSLKNSDIDVAVKEIDIVDNSGNIIKNLGYIYMEEGNLNFDISEKDISSPLNLKVTYTTLKSVSLPIDKRITIGL